MRLHDGYLAELIDYVHGYEHTNEVWMLEELSSIPFYWNLWLDENANAHALHLREVYCQTHIGDMTPGELSNLPNQASLLEVMIICAQINEERCHFNHDFDGSFRWFWQEMANCGFLDCRNAGEIAFVAERLLSRTFDWDGSGSMTGPIVNPKEDIRNMPFIQQIQVWDMRNLGI